MNDLSYSRKICEAVNVPFIKDRKLSEFGTLVAAMVSYQLVIKAFSGEKKNGRNKTRTNRRFESKQEEKK